MMNQADSPKQDKPKAEKLWLIVLLVIVSFLLGLWLWLTPSGFWGKLNAVGYSVCHQISERSFVLGEHQSPLCARCAGMYLGALATLIAHFIWGRHGKFPRLWVMLLLGVILVAFAFDGLNSAAESLPFIPSFYQTTNLTRLITGLGMGLLIGSILSPIFMQTAWVDWIRASSFDKWYRLPVLVLVLCILGFAIYSQVTVLFYIFNGLMALSVILILWLIHSTLAILFTRRANQAQNWRDLKLPALMGLAMVLVQMGLISALRYWLTGTWLPMIH